MGLRRIEPRLSSAVRRLYAGGPVGDAPYYLLYDNLFDANGTALSAHSAGVGGSWVTTAGTWTFDANGRLTQTANLASSDQIAYLDAGKSDGTLSVNVAVPASGDLYAYVAGRVQDGNNYWTYGASTFADANSGLFEKNGGTYTFRAGGASVAVLTRGLTYTIRLAFAGTSITGQVLQAGAVVFGPHSFTSSTFQTQTKFGVRDAHDANHQAIPAWFGFSVVP